ncbi:MAG: PLP-dependent aminotransferase family protein [Myxococcota bacterium]
MWLELDGDGPLNRQLDRSLRRAILEGRWAAGEKLPSSRALARDTGLARNTVNHAYAQLVAEGYAVARRGAGTFVADALPDFGLAAPAPRRTRSRPPARPGRLSEYGERVRDLAGPRGIRWSPRRARLPYEFRYGEPAFVDLPYASWCRALARRARQATRRDLDYGPPAGAPELQAALAGHLQRSRGVECDPEQLIVVHGSQQAIDLAVRVLVDRQDTAVVEDPHYPGHRLALESAGARVEAVPVDGAGLRVDRLPRADVRLVCVTPSHQFPSGAIMPLARRLELLAWARDRGSWILEDDYDGEFRYDGRPVASLQGLDGGRQVIYAGTVSKLLFPSLRIGYLVAPEALAGTLGAAKALSDTGGAGLEQRALADFIESGAFERHLRRARVRHGARRRALVEAVDEFLGDAVELDGTNAGVHVVMWLRGGSPRRVDEWRARAAALGVGVDSIRPFYRRRIRRGGLLVGYGSLDEGDIREGIRRLARALAPAPGGRPR